MDCKLLAMIVSGAREPAMSAAGTIICHELASDVALVGLHFLVPAVRAETAAKPSGRFDESEGSEHAWVETSE